MNKFFIVSLLALLVLPAWAEKNASYLRGGLGFLFPDANSFVNGGQMALNHGAGLEANFLKDSQAGTQVGTASFVWAGGGSGIGVGVTRVGTQLNDPATSFDMVEVQGGASLVKDNVTVGGVYRRALENIQGLDSVSGQFNFNFGRHGEGWVMGLAAGTTLGNSTNTKNGKLAMGYAVKNGMMMEAAYSMDDLDSAAGNYTASASFVYNGQSWYASGQYNDSKVGGGDADNVAARLGLIWRKLDLSAQVNKGTYTGASTTYGGTLRVVF